MKPNSNYLNATMHFRHRVLDYLTPPIRSPACRWPVWIGLAAGWLASQAFGAVAITWPPDQSVWCSYDEIQVMAEVTGCEEGELPSAYGLDAFWYSGEGNLWRGSREMSLWGTGPITVSGCGDWASVTVHLLQVAGVSVSGATEVDDGDNNDDTKAYVAGIADTGYLTVSATPDPGWVTELHLQFMPCWQTQGGEGDGKLARTVSQATAGSTTVTFDTGCSSKSVTVHVVEVADVSVSEGTEIDDGDNNPDTKAFVVCKENSGEVTITARPYPPLTEAQLAAAGCWTVEGGAGGLLTRRISKTAAGTQPPVVFSAGVSSKAVTIHVVEVAGVTVAGARQVEDGDGDPSTEAYVAYEGVGNVTVTAIPSPSLSEAQLANTCWTTTSSGPMTGTGKLTRSMSKGTPAWGTVTFQAGTSRKSITLCVIRITMITPASDPVNSPKQSGDGQNEFTFSAASPGVLTMNLKAAVAPAGGAQLVRSLCYFTVGVIQGSVMAWAAENPSGVPRASGDNLLATVTFTGLPANNCEFGKKKAAVYFDGLMRDEEDYEVFYPKHARNHPGGQADSPNWFYYWNQALGNLDGAYYGGQSAEALGEVRGMARWSYTGPQDKQTRYIYDGAAEEFELTNPRFGPWTGIDLFYNVYLHESEHVSQIQRADREVPVAPNTPWQYGWSWNQGLANHNHVLLGPDGVPGVPNVDDDSDGAVDNLIATGRGELGSGGDDEHRCYRFGDGACGDWPASWQLPPPPWAQDDPIEHMAFRAMTNPEHAKASLDWGDPGKQHARLNRYED